MQDDRSEKSMERGAAAEDWPTSEEEDLVEAPVAQQQEQQQAHQEHRLSPDPEEMPKDVASRVCDLFRRGQVDGFATELRDCTSSQLSQVIQKVAADTQCEKRKKHEKAKMIEHLGEVLQALGAREAGEVINVKDENGYSPIAIASKCKNHRLMHVLAQTNVCDLTPHKRNQDTIMHCLLAKSGAVEPPVELYIRCLDVIKAFPALRAFLTHQLARACYKTGLRKYPIHYLAEHDLRASFVRLFLQAIKESGPGALEVKAQTGETALLYHVRVTQGERPGDDYEPTLRLLVEGGCDLYAKDAIGRNALHIALERCSTDERSKGPTGRRPEVCTYITGSPIKLVAMLLELDVDRRLADLPDDMGITPRDLADRLKLKGACDSKEIGIIIRMMDEHKSGTLRKRNHDPDARRKGARERKRAKTMIAAVVQDHDAPQSHVLEIEDDEEVEREVKDCGTAEEAEEEEECVEASRGAAGERDGSSGVPPSAADGFGSPMSPSCAGHASTNAGLSRRTTEAVTHADWNAFGDGTSDTCTAVISMSSSASPPTVRESSSLPTASQQARARTSAAANAVGVNSHRSQSGKDAADRGTRGGASAADVSSDLERLQQKLAVVEQARTRAMDALDQGIDQVDDAVRRLRGLQAQMQEYEGLWQQLSAVIIKIIHRGVVVEVNGLECVMTRRAKVYCALQRPVISSSGGGDASAGPLSIDALVNTAEAAIAHLRELAATKREALRQARAGALSLDALAPYRMLLQRRSESIQQVRHASRVLLSRELSLDHVKKAVELETFLLQDSRAWQSQ